MSSPMFIPYGDPYSRGFSRHLKKTLSPMFIPMFIPSRHLFIQLIRYSLMFIQPDAVLDIKMTCLLLDEEAKRDEEALPNFDVSTKKRQQF